MIKTFTILAALCAAPASAATFDFEGLANGSTVTSAMVGGITATISATENTSGGTSAADVVIFDTLDASNIPADPDLVSSSVGGDLMSAAFGNALIIQESDSSVTPDDSRFGGTITFTFDRVVDLLSFSLLDDADLTLSAPGQTAISAIVGTDGGFLTESGTPIFAGVTSLSFSFAQSGAIDNIIVTPSAVPLPAALPLLAGALAGFGVLSRRRKAKTA